LLVIQTESEKNIEIVLLML